MPTVDAIHEGTIIGNYCLLQVLGHEVFGITYFACEQDSGQNIIVKECFPADMCTRNAKTGHIQPMYPELQDDYEAALASLKGEVEKLAAHHHKHVEKIDHIFESHGSIFYVTPWLIGGSLLSKLQDAESCNTPLAPEVVQLWLNQSLEALNYLHSQHIYHANIKPSHILFNEHDEVVLIDFNANVHISNVMDSFVQDSDPSSYAAPEQVGNAGTVGSYTDFYSLAAIWYRLISGVAVKTAQERLAGAEMPPLSRSPQAGLYPKQLIYAIEKNLSLDSTARFQCVRDWVDAFNAPIQAPRKVRAIKNQHTQRRRISIVVAALALIGIVWFASSSSTPQKRDKKPVAQQVAPVQPPVAKPIEEPTPTPPTEEPIVEPVKEAIVIDSPNLLQIEDEMAQIYQEWADYLVSYEQDLNKRANTIRIHRVRNNKHVRDKYPQLDKVHANCCEKWTQLTQRTQEIRLRWEEEITALALTAPADDATRKDAYLDALAAKNKEWQDAHKNTFQANSIAPAVVEELLKSAYQKVQAPLPAR